MWDDVCVCCMRIGVDGDEGREGMVQERQEGRGEERLRCVGVLPSWEGRSLCVDAICDMRYAILGSKGVENSRRMLEMVLEVGG